MTKSKFTELIAVRFKPDELARLQEAADDQGIAPSTLVRVLVNQALKPVFPRSKKMTLDEFREVMTATLERLDKVKTESFLNDISVGDPNAPAMLMWAGQSQKWEEYTELFLKALMGSLGIEVFYSEKGESEPGRKQPNASLFKVKDEDEIKALE